ncbi:MAG: hypothetical protein HYV27_09670 [Candidatus Hydrogenedentes bacterium]|nr:hypothetical protein [Candidatus Hydrogenedentota bacterium]
MHAKPFLLTMALLVLIVVCAIPLYGIYRHNAAYDEAFPPHSSLRIDPTGTQALHNALASQPALLVERLHTDLYFFELEEPSVVLLSGAAYGPDPESMLERFEKELERGSRVVISFAGWDRPDELELILWAEEAPDEEEKPDEGDDDGEGEGEAGGEGEGEGDEEPTVDISARWGFTYAVREFEDEESSEWPPENATRVVPSGVLPETVPWSSEIVFTEAAPEWTVIYERQGEAVVMERRFGAGSVVLSSDSYLLTNEGVRDAACAPYVSWLLGDYHRVIFSESHLGLQEQPGFMKFIIRFRLHGLLLALLITAALLAWRAAYSVVPRHSLAEDDAEQYEHRSRDASFVLVSLLHRSIPPDRIVATCVSEWSRSHPHAPVPRVAPTGKSAAAAVAAYRALQLQLSRTPGSAGKPFSTSTKDNAGTP